MDVALILISKQFRTQTQEETMLTQPIGIKSAEAKYAGLQCDCDTENKEMDCVRVRYKLSIQNTNMIQMECEKCQRWVHCKCYGYFGSDDPRINDFHFCYQCLYGRGSSAYHEAIELIKRRKLLALAINCGEVVHDVKNSLARKLAIPDPELGKLIGELQKDKFLIQQKGVNYNRWKVTKSARKLKSINYRYFNPKKSSLDIRRKTGTIMSSAEEEMLSESGKNHDSDTEYSEHDVPYLPNAFGKKIK
jgi:hypothetical protein